jgi:hypothetical protein
MHRLVVIPSGYVDGSNARVEVHDEEGFYGYLSTNLPEQLPDADLFWLKDWGENRGMVEAFLMDGSVVVEPTVAPVRSGFVEVKAARVAEWAR